MKTPINDYCGFLDLMSDVLDDCDSPLIWGMNYEQFAQQAYKEAQNWFKKYIKECRALDREREEEENGD